MVEIELDSAIIETSEDLAPKKLAAMRSAFDRLKAEFPDQPDEALAREVFIVGKATDDEDVIVNSAREIFVTFEEEQSPPQGECHSANPVDPGVNFNCFVLSRTTPTSVSLKPDGASASISSVSLIFAPGLRCNSITTELSIGVL
jgi:hypothetical protein